VSIGSIEFLLPNIICGHLFGPKVDTEFATTFVQGDGMSKCFDYVIGASEW
jgi:hypothetical protein